MTNVIIFIDDVVFFIISSGGGGEIGSCYTLLEGWWLSWFNR